MIEVAQYSWFLYMTMFLPTLLSVQELLAHISMTVVPCSLYSPHPALV